MQKLNNRWRKTIIGRCMSILSLMDQRKLIAVVILQICMGALDLLGVVAIGLLGALSVTGLQSQNPGNRVYAALKFLHISDTSFQTQASFIGIAAVILLVSRTMLSIFFTRRVLFFSAAVEQRSHQILFLDYLLNLF